MDDPQVPAGALGRPKISAGRLTTSVSIFFLGDDGIDSELPNEVDNRVRSEGENQLIAEIDSEALTSPLVLVLTTAGTRAFDADIDGDEGGGGGDGTGMGGNVQCNGKRCICRRSEYFRFDLQNLLTRWVFLKQIRFHLTLLNHINDGYRLPFFLKKGVGPQIPRVDTILNLEDLEIETQNDFPY